MEDIQVGLVEENLIVNLNSSEIEVSIEKILNTYITKDEYIEKEAGETLVSHKLVMVGNDGKVYYADKDTKPFCIGMTVTSALAGATAKILNKGKVILQGWNLIPGSRYYLNSNGSISNQIPTSGYILEIGEALDSNTLLLDIKIPIKIY